MGVPPKYGPDVAEEICRRLAAGQTLREICRDADMPAPPTVVGWARGDCPPTTDFAERYARAREIGWELMAEEALEISDDGSNDWVERKTADGGTETVLDHEHVTRSRLRTDTRKWLLSKRLPQIFGDKVAMEHSGELNVTGLANRLESARVRSPR